MPFGTLKEQKNDAKKKSDAKHWMGGLTPVGLPSGSIVGLGTGKFKR
jgi:hypothetical protein